MVGPPERLQAARSTSSLFAGSCTGGVRTNPLIRNRHAGTYYSSNRPSARLIALSVFWFRSRALKVPSFSTVMT